MYVSRGVVARASTLFSAPGLIIDLDFYLGDDMVISAWYQDNLYSVRSMITAYANCIGNGVSYRSLVIGVVDLLSAFPYHISLIENHAPRQ